MEQLKNFVVDKMAGMEKPDADLTGLSVKNVSTDNVTVESDVSVTNPYNHELPICEISYRVLSNNRELVSGKIPDPGSVKAKDKTSLKIPAKIPYSVLLNLMRDIGADWDIDYEMKIGLTVDIPVVGNLTLPLSKRGTLKLPTLKDLF